MLCRCIFEDLLSMREGFQVTSVVCFCILKMKMKEKVVSARARACVCVCVHVCMRGRRVFNTSVKAV